MVLFNLAQAAVQPIQITVQQPPGMPEWVKIILSAAVGAVFALGGFVAGEYLKPAIVKRHTRKRMGAQLNEEMLGNMVKIQQAKQILEGAVAPENHRAAVAGLMLATIDRDRFDYFFSEEKALVYEYDKSLVDFYKVVAMAEKSITHGLTDQIAEIIGMANDLAGTYAKKHNLTCDTR